MRMWRFHRASSLTYCLFGSISVMMLIVSSSLEIGRRTIRRRFHLNCASLMHTQVGPIASYNGCRDGSFWKRKFKNIHPLVIPSPVSSNCDFSSILLNIISKVFVYIVFNVSKIRIVRYSKG